MEYCIRVAEDKDQKSIIFLMKEHALFEGHELELSIQHLKYLNLILVL